MEGPVAIIDMWTVDEGRRDELLQLITDSVRRLMVPRAGFVSAEIYASMNSGMLLLNLRLRSEKDLQDVNDSAELQRVYREAKRIGTAHVHFYRLVASIDSEQQQH